MSDISDNSLHKEFELERMILFSDAVFAIAITLLILEIKFPSIPANYKSINLLKFFKPVIIHFFAFVISFFFIGMSWARHLELCKFLRQYNKKVIFLNLLLLFFIVTFPFSISAFIDNVNAVVLISVLVYMLNIFFVTFTQFAFAHYVLKSNPSLSVNGYKEEKQFFYIKAKYSFIMMLITIIVMVAALVFFNGSKDGFSVASAILAVLALIRKRLLKKYQLKSTTKNG